MYITSKEAIIHYIWIIHIFYIIIFILGIFLIYKKSKSLKSPLIYQLFIFFIIIIFQNYIIYRYRNNEMVEGLITISDIDTNIDVKTAKLNIVNQINSISSLFVNSDKTRDVNNLSHDIVYIINENNTPDTLMNLKNIVSNIKSSYTSYLYTLKKNNITFSNVNNYVENLKNIFSSKPIR